MRLGHGHGHGIVIVMLALLASLRAMGADAVRIAVVAGEGERAPKAGVVDRLMVELSKRPEVVILEREAIGKILAEQKLSLAGLTDHAHAVRLGLLLGADALLAVERLGQEQDKARQYRVKVIEAQTGLTAGDRFFDGPAVEKNPEIMAADVDRSLAWLRTPAGRRRYIAVLGYSAEQRGESLTDLPVALGALVESRIAQATNVLVVDREYLRRLQDEQELTGVERQLALSSYLIEGLIRPSATNAARVDVQTRIQPLQGSAEGPVLQSQGAVGNVSALAHDVAGTILRQIDADPLPADVLPAAQEASRLASHAQALQRYGETARSLPLLESAYVLDPKPGTALLLAETIKALAYERVGLSYKHMRTYPIVYIQGAETTNALPEAEKQELLESLGRAMRLWLVEMDQRTADSRDKTVPFLPTTVASAVHVLGPLWPRLRSEDPEASRLYRELRQQKEDCRRLELEYVKNQIPGSIAYYRLYVENEIRDIWQMSSDVTEYVAQMKQLMAPWLDMPGYTSPGVLWPLLMEAAEGMLRRDNLARFRSPEEVPALLQWCDWVSSRPSLHFKMAGLYFRVVLYKSVDQAQCAAPVRELVDLYPEFLERHGHNMIVTYMLRMAMLHYPYLGREQEWAALYAKIFDAVVTRLDRRSLSEWFNTHWVSEKKRMKRLGEDYEREWLAIAVARLPPRHLGRYRNDLYQAAVDDAYDEIETRRRELRHEAPMADQNLSRFWQAYRIEPVELGAARQPGEQLRLCKRDGDRLALVWATTQDDEPLSFRAEVCSLDGQPTCSFPSFTQRAPASSNAPVELRDVALDDAHVFVAAGTAGLLVFSRSDVRLYGGSEGLPRAALVAVTAAGSKLVLGFDADYLGAFDPLSGQFEEIAYSRSLLKRNPLDGNRQRFSVRGLASDPERACVWITTRQPDGVWRLSLPDGGLETVGSQSFDTLSVDDGTLVGLWRDSLSRYDPASARWTPIPLHGQTGYLEPLHVLLGPDIISAGMAGSGTATSGRNSFSFFGQMGLYLHKRVVREAFHLPLEAGGQPVHIDFLVKTSDRTALAGTRAGAFWRLTQPERLTPEEETLVREERAMDAFIAAQTNRVAARAVAASSTAAAAYSVTNLCDGRDGTCWAAATNATQGAWVDIELERPARLSSLRLVNGWVPDEKQLTLYPINHRVRQLDVTTDTGERARLDVEDHNDPQYLRVAFCKPVRRLRFTVMEIHESEVIDFEDPPWLNLSEITLFESR